MKNQLLHYLGIFLLGSALMVLAVLGFQQLGLSSTLMNWAPIGGLIAVLGAIVKNQISKNNSNNSSDCEWVTIPLKKESTTDRIYFEYILICNGRAKKTNIEDFSRTNMSGTNFKATIKYREDESPAGSYVHKDYILVSESQSSTGQFYDIKVINANDPPSSPPDTQVSDPR